MKFIPRAVYMCYIINDVIIRKLLVLQSRKLLVLRSVTRSVLTCQSYVYILLYLAELKCMPG